MMFGLTSLAIEANTNPPGGVGALLLDCIYLLGIAVLVLTFVLLWKQVFGRKPPIDEDLKIYSATVAKLQQDLARLPDDEKFAELVKRLDTFATVPQMAALQETFHREITNVDVYAHSIVHDVIRNDIGARLTELEADRVIRGERLAALESDVKTVIGRLRDLDVKIDRSGDRVIDKIMDLVRDGSLKRL